MNANRYRPTTAVALVLSSDVLGGALVGAAAELVGLRVLFPRPSEPPRDVLRAERPAVILVDGTIPAATDEAFLGPSLMSGARVFVFGREVAIREHAHLVERYRLELFVFPENVGGLLEALASFEGGRQRSRTR